MAKSNMDAATEALTSATTLLGTIIPMASLLSGVARTVIALAKQQGVEIGGFEEEIARFDAKVAELKSNYERWQAEHPV